MSLEDRGKSVSATDAERVRDVLMEGRSKDDYTEPRFHYLLEITAPAYFDGWRFFSVGFIPPYRVASSAGVSTVPFFSGIVALDGTGKGILMHDSFYPFGYDFSTFGKLLNYHGTKIQNTADVENAIAAFFELFTPSRTPLELSSVELSENISIATFREWHIHGDTKKPAAFKNRYAHVATEKWVIPTMSFTTDSNGNVESFKLQWVEK